MYIKETCEIRGVKEVYKFTPWRSVYPKGEKRAQKTKATTEAQKKVNERRAKQNKQRIIRANFEKGDLWLTFTYMKENRPDSIDRAKADRKNLLDKLRKRLQKEGIEFKYVCVTEIGSKGGVHHHMIMKPCVTSIIADIWKLGGVHIEHVYTEDLERLARYMTGDDTKDEHQRHSVTLESWSKSRNLIVPEVKRERIHARSFSKTPKPEAGYRLENLQNGINAWGYEWQRYNLVPNHYGVRNNKRQEQNANRRKNEDVKNIWSGTYPFRE